jgi:hypothetical protein
MYLRAKFHIPCSIASLIITKQTESKGIFRKSAILFYFIQRHGLYKSNILPGDLFTITSGP